MLTACWAAKGGMGTTVVASAMALLAAERDPSGSLLVDLAGDAPAVLGIPEPDGPGVSDWLRAGAEVPPDALGHLEIDAAPGLALLARGTGPLAPLDRVAVLAEVLALDARSVIVDGGSVDPLGGAGNQPLQAVIAAADRTVLVTRPCYVALRRALRTGIRPTSVVVVSEPGRALRADDVASVLGVAVGAAIDYEPAIARCVDAGLLASRVPRALAGALAPRADRG